VAKTLHRIEEKTLREEIEAVGFKLVAEATSCAIRMTRAIRGVPATIPVDEFVLKYRKPE
jgi:predicted methyltransferase